MRRFLLRVTTFLCIAASVALMISMQQDAVIESVKTERVVDCRVSYPVRAVLINQPFGKNPDPATPGKIHFHYGTDFRAGVGDPITSSTSGVVIYSGREMNKSKYDWGFGLHIKVRDECDRIWLYAHLSRIQTEIGKQVRRGERIGLAGYSGLVFPFGKAGSHLHVELRIKGDSIKNAVDPMSIYKEQKS
ncbi:M23 family metallopeptidase [Leptolyngbya sp. AN03gr2]|uniref:M23 family metallopeptidase n=1 Tax=Leptolyngbya sp. AN03gr2 TaxID=3423364 RepID=UPI003D31BB5D